MSWFGIVFTILIISGFIAMLTSVSTEPPTPGNKNAREPLVFWIFLGIALACALVIVLYILGWLWYYFCCGFLLFESSTFWDKVVAGFVSLILFAFLLGLIAIIGGWNPQR